VSQIRAYFERLLFTALASPHVKRVEKLRQEEDATGAIGFMRYRLTLSNDDLLELTERVEVQAREIVVTKYRHHWQDRAGRLIKRWDNAPHHPDVPSFPHHLHDGAEEQVVAHLPVDALHILTLIIQSIEPSREA
jgi:Family of unknown function (DUF6516)